MKKTFFAALGAFLVFSFGAKAESKASAAIDRLKKANEVIDNQTLSEDERTKQGLSVLYAGLKDWPSIKSIQTGTDKEDFIFEYLKLSGTMMKMIPDPDPVECLGTIYDSDRKLVEKKMKDLPLEMQENIRRRLKNFDPVDKPSKPSKGTPKPQSADAGPGDKGQQ